MSRVAIIDLHASTDNHSVGAMVAFVQKSGAEPVVFDLRGGGGLPREPYSAYLITGGPGPATDQQIWRGRLVAAAADWVKHQPVLGIGLGFCVLAKLFGWPIEERNRPRCGVHPLTRTAAGKRDPLLSQLASNACGFERRSWAVLPAPAAPRGGDEILAFSTSGDVAAARFRRGVVGTCFHPELPIELVRTWLSSEGAARTQVIDCHGSEELDRMIAHIDRLESTFQSVLPGFLKHVVSGADR